MTLTGEYQLLSLVSVRAGKAEFPSQNPHVCSLSKEQLPAGVVGHETPTQALPPQPREVCADSSESLTAHKKNYPDFLAVLDSRLSRTFLFPPTDSHTAAPLSCLWAVGAAVAVALPTKQERRTEGQKAQIPPWSSSSGVLHLCQGSAGGFTDSLKVSQLKQVPTATGK